MIYKFQFTDSLNSITFWNTAIIWFWYLIFHNSDIRLRFIDLEKLRLTFDDKSDNAQISTSDFIRKFSGNCRASLTPILHFYNLKKSSACNFKQTFKL